MSETSHNPRGEAFGYICRRCLHCCYHKGIQVNPYEVARLARRRGMTIPEFRDAFTHEGAGTALGQTETGACVFLGPEGCTVHPDRPLVCRLYPLGRHVLPDGTESFSHLEPHPRSEGSLTRDGIIAEFLEEQGALPFMQAADDYFFWFCRARERLGAAAAGDEAGAEAEAEAIDDLLDMDAAIAAHCAATGAAEPEDIEERRRLHLAILDRSLEEH